MLKFIPEMFGDDGLGTTRWGIQGFDKQIASECAQAAFNAWLAKQKTVFIAGDLEDGSATAAYEERNLDYRTDFTGVLINLKSIKETK